MLALQVHVNGKKRCVAGIGDFGVLSTILSWARRASPGRGLPGEELSLSVGGLDARRRALMDWLKQDLAVHDEVLIRIVNTRKADPPLKGSRRPLGNSERQQKAYVRRMAKQFGWKITTS